MPSSGKRPYAVTIRLPKQTVEVMATSESAAEVTALYAIGIAGIKHYGELSVVPVTRTAA